MNKGDYFNTELLLLIVKDLLPGSVQMSIPPADMNEISEILSNSNSAKALYGILPIIEVALTNKVGANIKELAAEEVFNFLLEHPILYSQLVRSISEVLLTCYYQRSEVLLGLGFDSMAPFPQGNVLIQSDLSMLEPVYLRGSIYKEVDEV